MHVGFENNVPSVEKKLLSYTKIIIMIFYVNIPHDCIVEDGARSSTHQCWPQTTCLLSSPFPFARILFWNSSKNLFCLPKERTQENSKHWNHIGKYCTMSNNTNYTSKMQRNENYYSLLFKWLINGRIYWRDYGKGICGPLPQQRIYYCSYIWGLNEYFPVFCDIEIGK